ncbi:methylenetetrahydrofolate reductase [Demequina sp. SYSU T00192]|uniref:Methylenetetrahydrofolate reductase n=1 Tax=Demequina litoralis TaxID=3051660 RepID=A0ABT8GAZ2_9MICO|nr:methylenetetrahydrofolate reductase [Demequina sp. SYSU T00192]MDN4476308.1 methylenetetrahydrofolate reductase [Demequina sp. SYSU T00192]
MHGTATLLDDFSLEMTARDLPQLLETAATLPTDTRVNVTYLGTEDAADRLAAAKAVADGGLTPVPHISARRVTSPEVLADFLGAHQAQGTQEKVFVIGGDPREPQGPYSDALSIIGSGILPEFGVREVGIGGYPEGHPDISDAALWAALADKSASIVDQGLDGTIITQFSFDTDAVLAWAERVRGLGIELPIRVGVPGPAGIKRLLGFARRCGVGSSTTLARKYGFSVTNLVGTAGPDRFVEDLASSIDPGRHGDIRVHFFTFGGLDATAGWVQNHLATV